MKSYHREWDEKQNCFRDRPHHDWSSHIADAHRYLGVVFDMMEKPSFHSRIILPPDVTRPANYSFNLDDLFNDWRTNPGLNREQ
jgi:hypothetical protein